MITMKETLRNSPAWSWTAHNMISVHLSSREGTRIHGVYQSHSYDVVKRNRRSKLNEILRLSIGAYKLITQIENVGSTRYRALTTHHARKI